jgi:hypothetical protein
MSAGSPPGAFQSYLDKWLEAEPDARLLLLFVPQARAPETTALLVLLHELEATAVGLDPQPARAKLAWWQEELRRWLGGAARHPITQGLGLHPEAPEIAALPAAAAGWLELETVASHGQWVGAAQRQADAEGRALSGGAGGGFDPAPVLARALVRFPRLATDPRGVLPLDVLAESRATRAEVAAAPLGEPARRTLAALARRALATPVPSEPRPELVLARSWLARHALERMARGLEPERAMRPGLGAVLGLRRALRRSRTAR